MTKLALTYLASPRDRLMPDGSGRQRIQALATSMMSVRDCLVPLIPDLSTIVFHEDYTEEDKEKFNNILPCSFEEVDFSGSGLGEYVRINTERKLGYLLMCRFFCGVLQKHDALQGFTHYLRLDDDSYFVRPRPDKQAVERMLSSDYAYRQIFWDPLGHDGLYEFTVDFLKQEGLQVPPHQLLKNGKYEGKAIFNNFHISSLRFWRHPLVVRYIDALEVEGAFLRKGWLDANVHTMIVALLGPHMGMTVHQEITFGYKHNYGRALPGSPWEWYIKGEGFVAVPENWSSTSPTVLDKVAPYNCLFYPEAELPVILDTFSKTNGKKFLEIGTYKGGTSAAVALTFLDAEVTTVDLPEPKESFWNPQESSKVGIAIRELGVEDRVTQVRMDSAKLSEWVRDGRRFDLIFIDGDHTPEVVLRDLLNAADLLEEGGSILEHDYTGKDEVLRPDWTIGVSEAVDEFLKRRPDFEKKRLPGLLVEIGRRKQ